MKKLIVLLFFLLGRILQFFVRRHSEIGGSCGGKPSLRFSLGQPALFYLLLMSATAFSQDTLTLTTHNLLNYITTDASRDQYYRAILRHVKPDILVTQEMTSQGAVDNYYNNVVNLVFPGQFTKAPFNLGPDTGNEMYFRTSKVTFVANTPIHTALRDISEFKIVHSASAETLRVYSVHLKASTGFEADRAAEVDSLRRVTNALPSGKHFIVVGDFNIYSSTEQAYQKLLQDNPTDDGHFLDAINITGTWNNATYAPYHTQSTRTRSFGGGANGGMDDRFDMILYSRATGNGGRITYVPNSMTTVGNDGLHYNDSINRLPNNAVPDSVANALHYASDHLPLSARFVFPTGPLPIQLAYFRAQPQPQPVLLTWGTVSETNNYGFEIQRRLHRIHDFETVPNSFTPGHGTTIEPHDYSYTDRTATPGELQYRLKQLDLDGTIHYTEPLSVTIVTSVADNSPLEFRLDQNYPNPFNPATTIRYQIPHPSVVTLKVYDLLGREVATLVNESKEPGVYFVLLKTNNLASGVYMYRFAAGLFVSTKRMIIMK